MIMYEQTIRGQLGPIGLLCFPLLVKVISKFVHLVMANVLCSYSNVTEENYIV